MPLRSKDASPRGFLLLRQGEWALVLAILVAVVATALIDANHSYWFRPFESLRDIARNAALLGIFALGATVVIIAGGIDLSAGSMIALSGTVCASTMLALAPAEMKVKVVTHAYQRNAVFFGGSLMASQDGFAKQLITKERYLEEGPRCARSSASFRFTS